MSPADSCGSDAYEEVEAEPEAWFVDITDGLGPGGAPVMAGGSPGTSTSGGGAGDPGVGEAGDAADSTGGLDSHDGLEGDAYGPEVRFDQHEQAHLQQPETAVGWRSADGWGWAAQGARGCPCSYGACTRPPCKKGSYEYYYNHLEDPVWRVCDADGVVVKEAPHTTRQAVFSLLEMHERRRVGKEEFDEILALTCALMPESFLPPSIYLLRRLSGAEDWSKYEKHVCSADGCPGHVYEDLSRHEWPSHVEDKCPNCSTPRFAVKHIGSECIVWGFGCGTAHTAI